MALSGVRRSMTQAAVEGFDRFIFLMVGRRILDEAFDEGAQLYARAVHPAEIGEYARCRCGHGGGGVTARTPKAWRSCHTQHEAALPHEHPKLGAVATLNMNGDDFASLLERSIERSRAASDFKPIGYAPAQGNDEHS